MGQDADGREVPPYVEMRTLSRVTTVGGKIELTAVDELGNLQFIVGVDRGELLNLLCDDRWLRAQLTEMTQNGTRI